MRRYDLTPLLRSSVGFDRFDQLFDAARKSDRAASPYPPYNIEKLDDSYRISLAVAGFGDADVEITVKENVLVVEGKAKAARALEKAPEPVRKRKKKTADDYTDEVW